MSAVNNALSAAIHESRVGEEYALTHDACDQIVKVVDDFFGGLVYRDTVQKRLQAERETNAVLDAKINELVHELTLVTAERDELQWMMDGLRK